MRKIKTIEEAQKLIGTQVTIVGDSVHHAYPMNSTVTISEVGKDGRNVKLYVEEGASYVGIADVSVPSLTIENFEEQLRELEEEREKVLVTMEEIRTKISTMNKYKMESYDDNVVKAQAIFDKVKGAEEGIDRTETVKAILDLM